MELPPSVVRVARLVLRGRRSIFDAFASHGSGLF